MINTSNNHEHIKNEFNITDELIINNKMNEVVRDNDLKGVSVKI